jgi:nucleotide-binding universal stress UspA family protein
MYQRIVVGTDGSESAGKAVEAAAGIARSWGSAIHVVTAYRPSDPGMGSFAGAALADADADRLLKEEAARQIARQAVDEWCGGLTAEAHAVGEDAADAILATAKSVGADLIVVGSRGMRGARRFLGSVPNSVCHGAECAVLVVKTD